MTAAHLSVVIVVIGAGPLFVSLWRRARRAGDHGTLAALSLPFAAPVTFLVILAGVAALVDHSRTPGVGIGAAWFLVLAGLGLVPYAVATGAACLIAAVSTNRGLQVLRSPSGLA